MAWKMMNKITVYERGALWNTRIIICECKKDILVGVRGGSHCISLHMKGQCIYFNRRNSNKKNINQSSFPPRFAGLFRCLKGEIVRLQGTWNHSFIKKDQGSSLTIPSFPCATQSYRNRIEKYKVTNETASMWTLQLISTIRPKNSHKQITFLGQNPVSNGWKSQRCSWEWQSLAIGQTQTGKHGVLVKCTTVFVRC